MPLAVIFLVESMFNNTVTIVVIDHLLCVQCPAEHCWGFRGCVLWCPIQWWLRRMHDLVENGKVQECELFSVCETKEPSSPRCEKQCNWEDEKLEIVFPHILVVYFSLQVSIFEQWVDKLNKTRGLMEAFLGCMSQLAWFCFLGVLKTTRQSWGSGSGGEARRRRTRTGRWGRLTEACAHVVPQQEGFLEGSPSRHLGLCQEALR